MPDAVHQLYSMFLTSSAYKTIGHPLSRIKSPAIRGFFGKRLGTQWLISIAFWILLGMLFASKTYIYAQIIDQPMSWWRTLGFTMPKAVIWGIATPLVLWFASLYKIDTHTWLRNGLIHLATGVLLAPFLVILSFLVSLLFKWIGGSLPDNPSFVMAAFNAQVFATSFDNILTYFILIGAYHVYDYYQRYRDRLLQATTLEAQLATLRLDLLKAQLNPHFLFNTLNAISIVKDHDLEAADEMITDLSELLRFIMENIHRQEVTLREEVDFLKRYISIQQKRFDNNLDITIDIDPSAWNAMVPSLLLQPIVENSIKHGMNDSNHKGKIDIECKLIDGQLCFQVKDNGTGLKYDPGRHVNGSGIGVKNTHARLRNLYGDNYVFELKNGESGGAVARLTIPYQWEKRD